MAHQTRDMESKNCSSCAYDAAPERVGICVDFRAHAVLLDEVQDERCGNENQEADVRRREKLLRRGQRTACRRQLPNRYSYLSHVPGPYPESVSRPFEPENTRFDVEIVFRGIKNLFCEARLTYSAIAQWRRERRTIE